MKRYVPALAAAMVIVLAAAVVSANGVIQPVRGKLASNAIYAHTVAQPSDLPVAVEWVQPPPYNAVVGVPCEAVLRVRNLTDRTVSGLHLFLEADVAEPGKEIRSCDIWDLAFPKTSGLDVNWSIGTRAAWELGPPAGGLTLPPRADQTYTLHLVLNTAGTYSFCLYGATF